jgi:hypothetical protein
MALRSQKRVALDRVTGGTPGDLGNEGAVSPALLACLWVPGQTGKKDRLRHGQDKKKRLPSELNVSGYALLQLQKKPQS